MFIPFFCKACTYSMAICTILISTVVKVWSMLVSTTRRLKESPRERGRERHSLDVKFLFIINY